MFIIWHHHVFTRFGKWLVYIHSYMCVLVLSITYKKNLHLVSEPLCSKLRIALSLRGEENFHIKKKKIYILLSGFTPQAQTFLVTIRGPYSTLGISTSVHRSAPNFPKSPNSLWLWLTGFIGHVFNPFISAWILLNWKHDR